MAALTFQLSETREEFWQQQSTSVGDSLTNQALVRFEMILNIFVYNLIRSVLRNADGMLLMINKYSSVLDNHADHESLEGVENGESNCNIQDDSAKSGAHS